MKEVVALFYSFLSCLDTGINALLSIDPPDRNHKVLIQEIAKTVTKIGDPKTLKCNPKHHTEEDYQEAYGKYLRDNEGCESDYCNCLKLNGIEEDVFIICKCYTISLPKSTYLLTLPDPSEKKDQRKKIHLNRNP